MPSYIRLAFVSLSLISLSACYHLPKRDVFTISQCLGKTPVPAVPGCKATDQGIKEVKLSDMAVAVYFHEVSETMRSYSTEQRALREGTSAIATIAAAAATFFNETKDSGATVTVLGAVATLVPSLQRIIGAGDKALAYGDGVVYMEKAASEYLDFLALNGGHIPADRLTPYGADFLRGIQGAIHLVEKALLARLPSPDEFEQALARSTSLKLSRSILELTPNGVAQVGVIRGSDIVQALSSNTKIVSAQVSNDKKTVDLSYQGPGNAIVTVVDDQGKAQELIVSSVAFRINPSEVTLSRDKPDVDVTVEVGQTTAPSVAASAAYSLTQTINGAGQQVFHLRFKCAQNTTDTLSLQESTNAMLKQYLNITTTGTAAVDQCAPIPPAASPPAMPATANS